MRIVAAVAAVVILTSAVVGAVRGADRGLTQDEAEYLHAGFLMHEGQRLYRDFVEHHAPFLFQLLAALVPEPAGERPIDTLRTYVTRARAAAAALGLGAMVAAAWLAWRVTRWPGAPVLVLASLAGAWQTWRYLAGEIRTDGPSLLLFWSGAALLLGRWDDGKRTAIASGTGIGLAIASAAVNPKWPLACLVLGAVFLLNLWRARRFVLYAIVPALAIVAAMIAILLRATTLRDYYDFTFDLSLRLARWWSTDPHVLEQFAGAAWMWCPPFFKGVYPALSAAIVLAHLAAPRLRERLEPVQRAQLAVILALALAALIEIRFLHPWPNIGLQVFMMWCFAAAVLHGAAAGLLAALLPGRARTLVGAAAVVLIAGSFLFSFADRWTRPSPEREYAPQAYLLDRLGPGDTVWLSTVVHPVLARDAHYYWYGFDTYLRYLLDAQRRGDAPPYLPRVTESELPPCRGDASLRFTASGSEIQRLAQTRRCVETLLDSGRAKRPPQPMRHFVEVIR